MHNPLGLYLHIPFCEKKCAYCDFYSAFNSEEVLKKYTAALNREIIKWGGAIDRPIDTIYIGGGTPSLLGERIVPLMENIKASFKVAENAEITAEVNPGTAAGRFLQSAKLSGVNRLSIGAQSGSDQMLKCLGRTHTAADTVATVEYARKLGFDNISLDLMIGLPQSDISSLQRDIEFVTALRPEHISAYILKIEPDTAFGKMCDTLGIPDDEGIAKQYLYMCDALRETGFSHYEISNFSKQGCYSRHNLKYWRGEEYLGIGPAAHSFLKGRRFYYPRDMHGFIKAPATASDGTGGDVTERLMLSLRLSGGINLEDIYNPVPAEIHNRVRHLARHGLINLDYPHVSLTDKGMLVSNSVILELTL